ncbi:hypothetical protein A2716_05255 [candidate division WWE3 bacterium RIFCSPHIGHO2_01_FULL_40_23]|uniref:Glycoside hydrolase family 5 domain-containing protein n=1 Tax=candidate division WWE3 bacterium RIFCSPLOWO2_01_FULL_41_18 TaxID=1802625 RepID=A0A1F4VDN9_UNCKA|nr:MAG: hypothetical protein A2716_05255 [candidate division WWE3 bacterium RIFCSPHIGHO2_01_FULL_40_23]OGC55277.1 MAG: hypothetical protein A3A78_04865 [candidate division WWE3 bacterium RIFCSPLOWO2_01_FULL_41_18]
MPLLNKHLKRDIKKLLSFHFVHVLLLLVVFFLILLPFLLIFSLNVHPAQNIEYGVTFSPKYAKSLGLDWKVLYLDILDDLKVDNLRLVAYWNEIESPKGEYDFSDLKWQIEEAEKRNVSIIVAIGRKVPRWPECHDPSFVKEMSLEEAEEALLKLLAQEVNQLKGYKNIEMWQVENEPYFPFGECRFPRWEFIKKEVALVRSLDPGRSVIVQDSGEGGVWLPTFMLSGDYLGISMYRRIWYDFWGVFLGRHIFFTYPLSYWSYPLKAAVIGVPLDRIKVLELQAEPWGGASVDKLPLADKDKTMSQDKFLETISYAQKTGISSFYFWGVEWWYWEKEKNDNPFFWEASRVFWKK